MLLGIMFFAVVMTYFLVSLLPPTYKSTAILSTGITIKPSILKDNDQFVQKFVILSEFSNLEAQMKSRNALRLLSYNLLLHDLTADSSSHQPFRVLDPEDQAKVTPKEKQALVRILNIKQSSLRTTTLSQNYDALFNKIAKLYEYDFGSLYQNVTISRLGETDYLKIEFVSEHPDLSEFAVNTYAKEYIQYNLDLMNKDENQAVNFWEELAIQKKERLDELNEQLSKFRKNRNLVDLTRQSDAIIGQITDLELERESERKKILGLRRNKSNLDRYIDKNIQDGSSSYSSATSTNTDYTEVQDEIYQLQEQSQKEGGTNPKTERSLQEKIAERDNLIDKLATNKVVGERGFDEKADELIQKRIDVEMDLSLAEESVRSIDRELNRLKGRSSGLVSADAFIEDLQGEKDIALEEYLQAEKNLNQARVNASGSVSPLSIFEHAQVPEKPEPANKILLAGFAGIASLSLSTFFLFVITLFDTTLSSPSQFEKFADTPLLGVVQKIKTKKLDLHNIFSRYTHDQALEGYKESLRKFRNFIERSETQTILFTSTKPQVGKSFFLLSLAYSLYKNHKNVLVIDANFKNNTLSYYADHTIDSNPVTKGIIDKFSGYQSSEDLSSIQANLPESGTKLTPRIVLEGQVEIIGNKRSSLSPSEIFSEKALKETIEHFKSKYDYILIEGAGLNNYSDTRELVDYADTVIAVFDAQSSLKSGDNESLSYLKGLGTDKFIGSVLNKVDVREMN